MKTLYKIREGRIIAGVCNGLSEYFNIDVNLIRLITALVCCSGAGLIVYLIASVILPEKQFRDPQ